MRYLGNMNSARWKRTGWLLLAGYAVGVIAFYGVSTLSHESQHESTAVSDIVAGR